MNLLSLSWKNLWDKPWNTLISLLLLSLGVGLISFLLHLNRELDGQFRNNIRGIDMVVGAKGSPLQLILSAVYHLDNPTGNIPLAEAEALKKNPLITRWIPLSYGDNHQGYRIVGTEWSYAELYEATLSDGRAWETSFETVVGALVAERLGIRVGDQFFGAHGAVAEAELHEEHPYKVVGILHPTGTVLDQLILTGLESVWEIHDHHEEAASPQAEAREEDHDHDHGEAHEPEETKEPRFITAVLISWRSPQAMMMLPRFINEQTSMQAAVSAIEVNRLFSLFSVGLTTLQAVGLAIMVVSALSLFLSLYNNLRSRRYELALMRSMGASRGTVFGLVLLEGLLLAALGTALGLALAHGASAMLSGLAREEYGFSFSWWQLLPEEGSLALATLGLGLLAALLPAIHAYQSDISRILQGGGRQS